MRHHGGRQESHPRLASLALCSSLPPIVRVSLPLPSVTTLKSMAILGQEYLIRQRHVNFELAFTSRWKFLAQDIGHKGCGAAGELCKNPRGAIRTRILFF